MLTYNIDVNDCLTNGARGKIIAIEENKSGYVERIIVKFDDECQGEIKRKSDKIIENKYPECTSLERVMFQYSLGKKNSKVSNTAKIVQFPMRLCFATTPQKFQGQTVVKPNKICVDLKSVFAAAQAYVLLSRVQSIEQLFIINSLPKDKFSADGKALQELERLNHISMNNNPSPWDKIDENHLKIISLTCQSLRGKIDHFRDDKIVTTSDIICLSESWLLSDENVENIQIDGYCLQANGVGRGKGIATYFRQNIFHHCIDIKKNYFQLSKFTSKSIDVISVYRYQEARIDQLLKDITDIVNWEKRTLICGDFNICYNEDRSNKLIATLENHGFKQLVKEATFIKGSLLDHVYIRECDTSYDVDCRLYSPYYTAMDHDALLTTVSIREEQF